MAFIFDANSGETPESIARQREIAAMLMGQGNLVAPRNTMDGIGNAFASIAGGYRVGRVEPEGGRGRESRPRLAPMTCSSSLSAASPTERRSRALRLPRLVSRTTCPPIRTPFPALRAADATTP